MKTRIEVNSEGEFYVTIPEDVIEAFTLDEGDLVEWDADDDELVILTFN